LNIDDAPNTQVDGGEVIEVHSRPERVHTECASLMRTRAAELQEAGAGMLRHDR
jgi:hypothetical protein